MSLELDSSREDQNTSSNNQERDKLTRDLEAIKVKSANSSRIEKTSPEVPNTETYNFLEWAQQNGLNIKDTEGARAMLDDPDLFNQPLRSLLDKFGISMEQARDMAAPLKKELTKVTGERFRQYIEGVDWRGRLQAENLNIDAESSSKEFSSEEAATELENILGASDIEFGQGAVWNMATSMESEWVAKFIKAGSQQGADYIMATEMQQYHQIRDTFGEELLLEQVAVELKDRGTPVILQEKLDLEKWRPMGVFNEGVYTQLAEIVGQNPQNKEILGNFLEKIRQLESQAGLILDFSGDNIVYQVDEKGLLNIKILDYGCTKAENDDPERIAQLRKHAETISSLLT